MDTIPLETTALVGAILGVASHLGYFIRGQHLTSSPSILAAFVALPVFLYFAVLRYVEQDPYTQARRFTLVATGSYISALLASISIYRLFFHGLGKFPGPTYLKLTKWSHALLLIFRGARNYQRIDEWHEKYGNIVRVGPNELSITKPEAVSQILGAGSNCKKSAWYDCLNHPNKALNFETNRADHDARRKIWDRGFSTKALRDYENRVRKYTDQLVSQINENDGKAINACMWFNYYSFDIMGDMAFGQSFDMVASGKEHPLIKLMNSAMASLGPLTPIIWILPILRLIPGLSGPIWRFIEYTQDQVTRRKQYEPESPDLFSWFIDAEKQSTNSINKNPARLAGDCGLVIVAGSDTTTATLSHIFYNLARLPHVLTKLRSELKTFYEPGSDSEFKDLQDAVYLNGVINEALRLHPPTPSGLQRLSPPEGMMIGDTFIPGDVTISTPFWSVGRLESCYKNATEFIPERWGEKPEMVIDKSVFLPFSTGPYGCVGKQLGLMELRNVTARIVSEFDVKFAPGEDGTNLMEKTADIFTLALAPMNLVFTRKESADLVE